MDQSTLSFLGEKGGSDKPNTDSREVLDIAAAVSWCKVGHTLLPVSFFFAFYKKHLMDALGRIISDVTWGHQVFRVPQQPPCGFLRGFSYRLNGPLGHSFHFFNQCPEHTHTHTR